MLLSSLALAFQVTVSINVDTDDERQPPRRIAVTAEHLRTAFKDDGARRLLARAREARLRQDSALVSYEAKTYQRISMGMSIRETARDRLFFRSENAARVRWHRDGGAEVEVLGFRAAVPAMPQGRPEFVVDNRDESGSVATIPYYPGKEPLISFNGGGLVQAEVDERNIVHPLATGSEAYYTYESGDSVTMLLPDGTRIQLRELRIAAREPRWNVAVGSFWFDTASGLLVRAVYRMSSQMNIREVAEQEDSTAFDDVPLFVRPIIFPMQAEVTAMTVEYGLQDQRFWLPKLQALEGYARVSFMRMPFRVEERFRYETVNALDSVPVQQLSQGPRRQEIRDSLYARGLDSAAVRDSLRAYSERRDSLQRADRTRQCAATGRYVRETLRSESNVWTRNIVPCDSTALSRSSELPPSIYDPGEELFGEAEMQELVRTLDMSLQPGWAPQRPRFEYSYAMTRYNRAEGLGTGANLRMVLGNGFEADAHLRASIADRQANGELGLARGNGRNRYRGAVYRRLAVSSDFGAPLSFGASMATFLYARDEGFYHRAWGAELAGGAPTGGGFEWRLFSERQWTAPVQTRWSVFGGANDPRHVANVMATPGWYHGAAARWRGSYGLDTQVRARAQSCGVEAAVGAATYQRVFLETVASRGFGPLAASVTAAAGAGFGTLPAQRQFFLGGLQSVRGQSAGAAIGETFWMLRNEIGSSFAGARPVVFADLGWAGARDAWGAMGRPISGAGIGASFLDGIVRFDVARGIYPTWQTRVDFYFEARF